MGAEIEFLRAVRDGKDVFPFLSRPDFGYGWAVSEGFVTKHPAFMEFYLTAKGQNYLATKGGRD